MNTFEIAMKITVMCCVGMFIGETAAGQLTPFHAVLLVTDIFIIGLWYRFDEWPFHNQARDEV